MTLAVESRGVYGRELFYPVNAPAQKLCQLIGCRALTRAQLQLAKDLGFSVTVQAPALAQI